MVGEQGSYEPSADELIDVLKNLENLAAANPGLYKDIVSQIKGSQAVYEEQQQAYYEQQQQMEYYQEESRTQYEQELTSEQQYEMNGAQYQQELYEQQAMKSVRKRRG